MADFRRRTLRKAWLYSNGFIMPVATIAVLALLWEQAVHLFGIPEYLLPAPSVIWADAATQVSMIFVNTQATLITIICGFLLSIVVSLPLAVMITSSQLMANTIYPLLVLTHSVPKIALAPILVVALGVGETPRLIVTFLVAFFPLVTSLATGLLAAPADLIELGRSYRITWWQELFRIRLIWAVPFLFNGLKLAMASAVIGAVVAEFVAAEKGLGFQIMSATAFFNTPSAFSALVILSVLGIMLFQLVVLVERVFFPWSLPDGK